MEPRKAGQGGGSRGTCGEPCMVSLHDMPGTMLNLFQKSCHWNRVQEPQPLQTRTCLPFFQEKWRL